MKVFIVSEAGSVADVTLHTSCSMADHSALKVSQPGAWSLEMSRMWPGIQTGPSNQSCEPVH